MLKCWYRWKLSKEVKKRSELKVEHLRWQGILHRIRLRGYQVDPEYQRRSLNCEYDLIVTENRIERLEEALTND